jgi:hypothetical protein
MLQVLSTFLDSVAVGFFYYLKILVDSATIIKKHFILRILFLQQLNIGPIFANENLVQLTREIVP